MEQTCVIYRKGEKWYRSATEIPRESNDMGLFPAYDEKVYVEIPGYVVPIDLTLEQLVDMHLNKHWGKHFGGGLRSKYVEGEHVACSGHEREVAERAEKEGFPVG